MRRFFAAFFLLALVGAACTSSPDETDVAADDSSSTTTTTADDETTTTTAPEDTGTSDEETALNRLAESLQSDVGDDFDTDISDDEAICVAREVADVIGFARTMALSEDEDLFTELSEEEVVAVVAAMRDCVADFDAFVRASFVEGLLEGVDESFPVTEPEAECIADGLLTTVGIERIFSLAAADSDFSTFPPDVARPFASAFVNCLDLQALFAQQFADAGAPQDFIDCVIPLFTDDVLTDLFEIAFSSQDQSEFDTLLEGLVGQCAP